VATLGATALAVSACGSSNSSSSGSASTVKSAGSSADAKAKAEAAIAPYIGHPSAFPVTTPLSTRPTGKAVTYVDCGTPVCALFRTLVTPAAKTMGLKMSSVKAAGSAENINSAMEGVASSKPAGVILSSVNPIQWQGALGTLKSQKIPMTATGIVNGDKYGLTTDPNSVMFGATVTTLTGKLQADWTYNKLGDKANSVYYYAPELDFMTLEKDSYLKEMASLCPTCKTRAVTIPVASLGNTAPQTIVSDLQAHPETKAAVAANSEIFIGLPSALKTAGITITTVGTGGGPASLQYVKDGQQTVDLALDLPVLSWSLVDAVSRPIVGEKVPAELAKGLPPMQFLERGDIKFDPSKGWTGYPDFAQRFSKLWGVSGGASS
jgi:ribose transport system substrate-binding protein